MESLDDILHEKKPKKVLRFITDILKVSFGFGCFVNALVLAFGEDREIPALFETKMYYVFISLFLVLSGLDSLEDTITDEIFELKSNEHYFWCVLITHSLILILYIPFVIIGFVMAKSRMKASWDDR